MSIVMNCYVLQTILQRQLGMYPLIVLKDMQFSVLKSLIEFMYCGETSVTEDNLSALLQAAKFFQVKGLSAMTKEALGLTSPVTPKTTTTVNGEAARKAFVGRSKRVGMQQTFVASGLKSVTPSSSHGEVHTPTTGKTIFQTTPKAVPVRQDTHQQQQTDTAQLLLSLSGSEFPKQTFHTVSKNVRFHHGTPSGNVTVEPTRTCSLESTIKNKEPAAERVPSESGMKSTTVVMPEKALEQQIISDKTVEGTKEDLTSQVFYVEDGPCKRGRPMKRQVNLVFKEKVIVDTHKAFQKEEEASRKAIETIQHEMSAKEKTSSLVVTQPVETLQQNPTVKQQVAKPQQSQVNNMVTTPRILPKEPKLGNQKTAVGIPEPSNQNVIYQVAGNAIDANSNETNIVYQLQEGQDSGNGNIVYQVADNTVLAGQDAANQNIIYQVADNASTSTEGNNTNIIYQVADGNVGSGTNMSQYMEVLKEAGLPSDVPILLESSDGSYVTVNEEVLMNIMNGGMIQVSDGSIVGGEGVQFIVQEVQELNEGQVEGAAAAASTAVAETTNVTEPDPTTPSEETAVKAKPSFVAASGGIVKHSTYKPAKGQQNKANVAKSLPSLEPKEAQNIIEKKSEASSDEIEMKPQVEEKTAVPESVPMEITESEPEPQLEPVPEAPMQSDEIITGDSYGEEAMEGFAVIDGKDNTENKAIELAQSDPSSFIYPDQSSNETIIPSRKRTC
ncbi:hypothetical protein L9F63_019761 [Diploptera punctata]|uniref:BTB domain-containing protein n=1 Tax=Diploptera punctata TaxID=6984 RepID=A0AAD7ZTN7_DIPPU|nr:hypothetical protein L9F63_019761 [Diploptera punctata]